MYPAIDRLLDYVINRGLPFILLLVLIYLIYRYYTYGMGNKTIICPSVFGNTYDYKCLNDIDYAVDMQNNLIKKSDLIK